MIYTSSKSSSNLDIELRTSRTLHPSPKVELYELELLKKVELQTRTQVRSTTSRDCAWNSIIVSSLPLSGHSVAFRKNPALDDQIIIIL